MKDNILRVGIQSLHLLFGLMFIDDEHCTRSRVWCTHDVSATSGPIHIKLAFFNGKISSKCEIKIKIENEIIFKNSIPKS